MDRIVMRSAALLMLLLGSLSPPLCAQNPIQIRVRAAIIDNDMNVRPVPQTLFLAVSADDTVRLETDLDGIVEAKLLPGRYQLISASSVKMNGTNYLWSVEVDVTPGMKTVELTQKNAFVQKTAGASPSASLTGGRRVSEEAQIFDAVKSGVFTVAGAAGHGSGFLVDQRGIVLTNAHVVADVEPDQVRVAVNTETVVRGRLLHISREHDVAAIAISPDLCAHCAVLTLANPGADPIAVEGERVLAIGSPLSQRSVLTIGIVSRVEPRAIISDVNVNPGNSGGPMLNLAGEVIAINSFLENDRVGPGVSGSVVISQAAQALAAAHDSLSAPGWEPPSAEKLPVLAKTPFPAEGMKAAASMKKMNLKPYITSGGPFEVQFMTPPVMAFRESQALQELAERRKKREQKGNVTENEKVDNIQAWYGWAEYVGDRRPAVVIQVTPKIGQTGGSLFANILMAGLAGYAGTYYSPHAVYEFKGDFRRMKLLRDGQAIEAVEENRLPAVLNVQDYFASGKDLAYQGIYVYRPEDFGPREDGTTPRFQLMITNTGKPNEPIFVDLDPKTVTAVHHDFDPWRLAQEQPVCSEDPNGAACALAMTKASEASGLVLLKDAEVFEGPSTWNKILGKAKKGTPVVVLRTDGKWTFVRAGEFSGYVGTKFVGSKDALKK